MHKMHVSLNIILPQIMRKTVQATLLIHHVKIRHNTCHIDINNSIV